MTQPTHASLSSLNKHAVAAFCSFVLLIAATTAHAQDCYTDPEDWVASSWHQNNPMYWDGLDRKSINLGDPTILKLQDATGQTWFFITGTDSGQNLPYPDIDSQQNRRIGATNYVIYRSTNLVDWYLHSYVFNRDTQGTHSWDMDTVFMPEPGIPNNPDRFFKRLGSPHLYYNPNNGDDYIYLTFSASQLYDPGVDIGTPGDNNLDNDYYDPPANQNPILDNDLDADNNEYPIDADSDHLIEQQKTCFVLWTEKSRFLQGNLSWTGRSFRSWFPVRYHYSVNNTGTWKQDGGIGQAIANGDSYVSIPTTGAVQEVRRYKTGQYLLGNAVLLNGSYKWGFHWAGVGPRAWMGVDSVVYFDPDNNCQPWVAWSWAQHSNSYWDNNNIAAYPLLGGNHWSRGFRLTDALYQNPHFAPPNNTQPIQLMFAYDPDTLFPGTSIPNGRVVAKTNDHDEAMLWAAGGVAEGTEIFTSQPIYNDWTYLMAARNPWDQPSYQIVYRRTTGGIESLHLPWGGVPSGANERVLLASNWVQKWDGNREKTDRTNFGGAEHFRAYGREYIICHKLSNTDDPINTARELLIKELTWDTQSPSQDDGIIFRLFDGYPSKYLDVNWFAGPNVLGLSSPPVP